MEEKLLELSANQKKFLEVEAKLIEAEKRPTAEQLQQAVQQEREKYKDYDSIKASLDKCKEKEEVITSELSKKEGFYSELSKNYSEIKKKYEELQVQGGNLPPPIVELGKEREEIAKNIKELLNSALNPLQLEIAELKKQLINNPLSENSSKLPIDYEELKVEKKELLRILETLKLRL